MDARRRDDQRLGGFLARQEGGDILRHHGGLGHAGPGRLVRPRVGDVADGEEVRVLGVSELQGRADADEAVGRVREGLSVRGGGFQRAQELVVRDLARGDDGEVGRDAAPVPEGDGESLAVRGEPLGRYGDAGYPQPIARREQCGVRNGLELYLIGGHRENRERERERERDRKEKGRTRYPAPGGGL